MSAHKHDLSCINNAGRLVCFLPPNEQGARTPPGKLQFKFDDGFYFAHSGRGMWSIEQRRGRYILVLTLHMVRGDAAEQSMGSYKNFKKAVSEANRADRILAKQAA